MNWKIVVCCIIGFACGLLIIDVGNHMVFHWYDQNLNYIPMNTTYLLSHYQKYIGKPVELNAKLIKVSYTQIGIIDRGYYFIALAYTNKSGQFVGISVEGVVKDVKLLKSLHEDNTITIRGIFKGVRISPPILVNRLIPIIEIDGGCVIPVNQTI